MPSEKQLQELWDKQEIAEVLGARYGRGLDWLDEAALKDCFHADAQMAYGSVIGNAHDWCAMVMPIEAQMLHRFHYVFNILIEVNGDKAEAESNSLAGGRSADGKGGFSQTFFGSRYLDKLEWRDGAWRISERRILVEFAHQMPISGGLEGGLEGLELVEGLSPQHALYRRMDPRKG